MKPVPSPLKVPVTEIRGFMILPVDFTVIAL